MLSVHEKFEQEALDLYSRYSPVFEEMAKTPLFTKSGREWGKMDAYNLGKQLDMYKQYEAFVNESDSAGALGILPKVATDLIAATYAVSIAPLLASMQTIPEQQGIVYFKRVSAGGMINKFPYTPEVGGGGLGSEYGPQGRGTSIDRNGNMTPIDPGLQFIDARRGWVNGSSEYATEQIMDEQIDDADIAAGSQTQLKMFPVRSNLPVRLVGASKNGGVDNLVGTFLNRDGGHSDRGVLMTSTGFAVGEIRYSTGQIAFSQVSLPNGTSASDYDWTVSYMQDFETAADIPTITMTNDSTEVTAEVLAVKQNISTLRAFAFSQRFGRIAEDDALMDLAGTMADIESRRIIEGYVKMANWIESQPFSMGNPIEFSRQAPAGLGAYEYRQGFRYELAEADAQINLNCGRGAANRYIAGHEACVFISSLPKFESAPANLAVGPHVFGYFDGKPVIRTQYLTGLRRPDLDSDGNPTGDWITTPSSNAIIAGYLNPQSPFDAPLVEATYMPVFITNTMQIGYNPLQNARAIASWKAFKNVVPHYVKPIALVA